MITDPAFYAAAIPAVMIVGLSKAGFLQGMGVIGVPLIALVIPPIQAAGIMLPILLAMDVFAVWAYRRSFDGANLAILMPGALIGIAVGWLTASIVSDAHVRLIVGLVALAFTLDHMLGRRERPPSGRSVWKGTIAGSLAGFTSFVSHSGGPPYQMYMLPQRLDPRRYAGTSVILFAAVNAFKVLPYAALGQLGPGNLLTSAVLAPLAPLSIWIGYKLVQVVRPDTFYRLMYGLVFVISLKLIWDGGRALTGW